MIGLKAQHLSCVNAIARASNSKTTGCFVGSTTFEMFPPTGPQALLNRNIDIDANSAASALLVFQAILPFLLFAADQESTPISLSIKGGTNVSFSLSYEYLDQVLLPTLEDLGIAKIERTLERRGWSHGSAQVGRIRLKITPIPFASQIRSNDWLVQSGKETITKIDVSIIVPLELMSYLKDAISSVLSAEFPGVNYDFPVQENSGHRTRIYTFFVAHTTTGHRYSRDWLYDRKIVLPYPELSKQIASKVIRELLTEIERGMAVDEYLEDQLVIFQALAGGVTCVGGEESLYREVCRETGKKESSFRPIPKKKLESPFGSGSLHSTTARWVVSQFLPQVEWYGDGRICKGAGWHVGPLEQNTETQEGLQELHI